jgi:copper(I)-binding protein
MAQGTTTYPTTVDAARTNPSNVDSTEAAMIAVQTKLGENGLLSGDGAITVADGVSRTLVITKGSAAALTLAAPGADYQRLTIVSSTAFAHVITSTDKLDDGVTGGAKDTATFGAFAGASIELLGYDGTWHVISKNVVTIAAV